MNPNEQNSGSRQTDIENVPDGEKDDNIDTVGPDTDDGRTLDQKSANAADEAGSSFLPHDKVLDREQP